ncbi:hypothetical protein ACFQ2B_00160 [Streptomyces stramineus]
MVVGQGLSGGGEAGCALLGPLRGSDVVVCAGGGVRFEDDDDVGARLCAV